MNRKFYVKKIGSGDTKTNVDTNTTAANGGSILKTGNKVGIYRKAGSNYYNGSDLNDSTNGIVLNSTGTPMPTYSNFNNKDVVKNSTVRSVFNKFFTNGNKGTTTPTAANWGQSSGLNAFAYMNSNLWNNVDTNKPTAS